MPFTKKNSYFHYVNIGTTPRSITGEKLDICDNSLYLMMQNIYFKIHREFHEKNVFLFRIFTFVQWIPFIRAKLHDLKIMLHCSFEFL